MGGGPEWCAEKIENCAVGMFFFLGYVRALRGEDISKIELGGV
jgi:hypothetical protein